MTDQLKRAISAAQTAQINDKNDKQAEATRIASSSAGDQTFDMSESSYKTSHTAIRKARRFAMQGLYEWLVTDRRFDIDGKLGWKANAPHDIAARTRATNAMHTVHIGYYHEMMRDIPEQINALDALISKHLDREINKLDTVEHAILLVGAYELQNRLEIPYKVVLDEAMKLNNHFGATDAHKLINAVLDRMAVELRAPEVDADSKANLRTSQKAAAKPVIKADDSASNSADVDTNTLEEKPAALSKPRISANNASVKRNSASKALANITDYKVNKQNEGAKDIVVADSIIDEKPVEEKPVENSIAANEENTTVNNVINDVSNVDTNTDNAEITSAADVELPDSNAVSTDSEESASDDSIVLDNTASDDNATESKD